MKREKYYDLCKKYENLTQYLDYSYRPEYHEIRKTLWHELYRMICYENDRFLVAIKKGKYIQQEDIRRKTEKVHKLFTIISNNDPITVEDYTDTWIPCSFFDLINFNFFKNKSNSYR